MSNYWVDDSLLQTRNVSFQHQKVETRPKIFDTLDVDAHGIIFLCSIA